MLVRQAGLCVAPVPALPRRLCTGPGLAVVEEMSKTPKGWHLMTHRAQRIHDLDTSHRLPTRWALPATSVSCTRCGEDWETGDPALRVGCPACKACALHPCRRGKGGNEHVCAGRDLAAERLGLLSVCPALSWTGRHSKPQPFLCSAEPPPGAMPILTASPAVGARP